MNLILTAFEGQLAAEPVLEETTNGTPVCTATVLINRRKKQGTEWVDAEPTRRNIKAWRTTATKLGALTKGTTVVVIGDVETESWVDDEGTKRWRETVVVESIGRGLLLPRDDQSEHITMGAANDDQE
jgi:single-strand DNA-binding protein